MTGAAALPKLSDQGRQRIDELAQRYSVSADAVMTLLQALVTTNGTMAQFNHAELGGGGQWMQGGMTMVADMFNSGLKSKVDGLCSELSQLLAQQPFVPRSASFQSQSQAGGQQQGGSMRAGSVSLFVPEEPGRASSQWWPADLGFPNGTGAQNHVRYAYFNAAHRLAVELNGHVTVYDSLDHQISGVSQQQGSGGSLTFTSQDGTVSVSNLPILSVDGVPRDVSGTHLTAEHAPRPEPYRGETTQDTDIFAKIERLADLQQKGILSPEEFAAKKAELLSRL
jgi:Short C-terminal domain